MMTDIAITVKLFGAFRKYGETLTVKMPAGCTVQEIKSNISKKMDENDALLVGDSAFAFEDEFVGLDLKFDKNITLAIMPPVCGG